MKVLSLNTWGGRGGVDALLAFVAEHATYDVLCFQEVWNGGEEMLGTMGGGVQLLGIETQLLARIQSVLPEHVPYFRPLYKDFYGLLMMVRTDHEVLKEEEHYIYRENGFVSEVDIGDHARVLQAVHLGGLAPHVVIHLHGLWQRVPSELIAMTDGKQDNPDRIRQSERIVEYLQSLTVPYVLVGDFNLLPDSESIRILEAAGAHNLIRAHAVISTRTRFYTKPGRYADYAFTSPGIITDSFAVLPDEVSDHAPLAVTYSLA